MNSVAFYTAFITGIKDTTLLEYIAVFAGIASVLYSRIASILVYPVGLISTLIYIYLSLKGQLIGEAGVNVYYTIMSIWGWWLWTRKGANAKPELQITFSSRREWVLQLAFCALCYVIIFASLTYLKKQFAPGAIPWADAFASATAFTGMWLMARKKVENWLWWILTDLASIPLYFVKGYVFTSIQFLVFTILAIMGLLAWRKKALKATFPPLEI